MLTALKLGLCAVFIGLIFSTGVEYGKGLRDSESLSELHGRLAQVQVLRNSVEAARRQADRDAEAARILLDTRPPANSVRLCVNPPSLPAPGTSPTELPVSDPSGGHVLQAGDDIRAELVQYGRQCALMQIEMRRALAGQSGPVLP